MCCLVGLFVVIALTLDVKTNSQQRQVLNLKEKGELLKQVENSAEIPFNVIEDEDSPFKITEAKVKEISGSEFTKLTGKTTDLATVMSFPEVKLINTSGKTITSFWLAVRNTETKSVRGFIQYKISVSPGQNYTVSRDNFASPRQVTVSDSEGVRKEWSHQKWDSEKLWLDFAKNPNVFVAIGHVTFDDGSEWLVSGEEPIK